MVLGVVAALAVWLGQRMAEDTLPPDPDAGFVRAEGRGLVRDGTPFRFRAVGFGNLYSLDVGEYGFSPDKNPHHDRGDFDRVADLGFNAIRFAINGNWYRDDPRGFWRWLDRNVGWARDAGLLLILDLHVPIGGAWLDASDGPGDFRIWTDPEIRARTVDFWRAVATRYRDEPAIGAYDILNEPVTTDATGDQWRAFAAELATAIRAVDPEHLMIVGPVYGTEGAYRPLDAGAQFLIDDPNVMYDFHFYDPVEFTHQTADWLDRPIPDGGRYPDTDLILPTGSQVLLEAARILSPAAPPGDSGWARYESDWIEITDPRAVAALPTAVLRGAVEGEVGFDAIEVFEHDTARDTVTRVAVAPLDANEIEDWWAWSSTGDEAMGDHFARVTGAGANDSASLTIAGPVRRDGFRGWSSDTLWFRVTPGNRYRISGDMSGSGVAYPGGPATGFAGLALDIYADPPGSAAPGFLPRGKEQLAFRFNELARFGERHEVPMSVMEFGTIRTTFEVAGKGGAAWVADMLDILEDGGVSYALWNYHGPSMGLYLGEPGRTRTRPNQTFIGTVERHLSQIGPQGG